MKILGLSRDSDVSSDALAVELSQGSVTVRAFCIPPHGRNWSLSNLYTQEELDEHTALVDALGRTLSELGVVRAYAPAVSYFSGLIASPCKLNQVIALPPGIALYRNRNLRAEGTWIGPGEAVIMGTGGCATAIAIGEKQCIVAHAGRDSLIERERLLRKSGLRPLMSVVDDMAQVGRNRGANLNRMAFHALFALPAETFSHPIHDAEHGDFHRKILAYANELKSEFAWRRNDCIHLDIKRLAVYQAEKAGFGSSHGSCSLPLNGPFGYTRHENPTLRKMRNLVVIVRTA